MKHSNIGKQAPAILLRKRGTLTSYTNWSSPTPVWTIPLKRTSSELELRGVAENAGPESTGPKMKYQISGPENAGPSFSGPAFSVHPTMRPTVRLHDVANQHEVGRCDVGYRGSLRTTFFGAVGYLE